MDNRNEIKKVIDSFYGLISGKTRKDRDWDKFQSLFYKGARLLNYKSHNSASDVISYVKGLSEFLRENDFYEYGFDYKIDIYGSIAQVSSRYEAKETKESKLVLKRGRNLIQLVFSDGKWRIFNMLWEDE